MDNLISRQRCAISLSLLIGLLTVAGGCTSRYRLDMFIDLDEIYKRVDVESSDYVMDAVLGDPMTDDKIVPGDGSVAVVTIGTRWKAKGKAELSIVGFDEYLRMQIYLGLAPLPGPDSVQLVDNSVAQMLGQYDQPPARRVFLAENGFYRIDSVSAGNLFITLQGDYANTLGEVVTFNGEFWLDAHL